MKKLLRAAAVLMLVLMLVLVFWGTLVKTEEQLCPDGSINTPCGQKKPHSLYQEEDVYSVTYEQLKQLLPAGNLQLFDVREPDEFKEGAIPGAINIPLSDVEQAFTLTPDQFTKLYGVLMPEKRSLDVMLYCQRGRRSLTALRIMHSLGYSSARHYVGGYGEWFDREVQ